MSVELLIAATDSEDAGTIGAGFLGTNVDWAGVLIWCEGLDPGTFPNLIAMTEHGYCGELPALAGEIAEALKRDPPDDVAATLEALAGQIAEVPDGAVALVSDGVNAGE